MLAGENSHGTKTVKTLKMRVQDDEGGHKELLLSAKKIHFSRTPSKYRCKVKVKKKAAFRLLKLVQLMNEFELLVLLFQQPIHHSSARYCDEWEL